MCPILQPRIENGVQMAVGSISMMYFAEQITPKRHSLKQEFYFLWPRKSSIWAGLRWVILMKVIRSVQESKTASPIYLALWWGWLEDLSTGCSESVLKFLTWWFRAPKDWVRRRWFLKPGFRTSIASLLLSFVGQRSHRLDRIQEVVKLGHISWWKTCQRICVVVAFGH